MGYVLKDEALQVVVRAIRTVLHGDTWFSRAIVEKMARLGIDDRPAHFSPTLTERETQVLQLMAAGQTDRQIGLMLGLAERTVRNYLQSIYTKMGVRTRVEAAVRAAQSGLVDKG